ncbi:unnamed protein product [Bemisia tabaci]|uniref:Ubiquitin-like modifier-activating enzyme ATG7 n=1 Tax=Bemisia tabaci TaxID=7038 RepID=A0A9P0A3B8_BEMTA|nr:unnamed protein product [Bemisia tabaci]
MASNLLFSPFVSSIEPSFWHKAAQLKLETDMLQEVPRSVWGYYSSPDVQPFSLSVDYSAFNVDPENESNRQIACGVYLNKNTIESFKACDKKELLKTYGEELLKNVHSGAVLDNPSLLSSFFVLTFADLKKFNFYYWFAFPSPALPAYRNHGKPDNLPEILSDSQMRSLVNGHSVLPKRQRGFFGVKVNDTDSVEVITLKQYLDLTKSNEDFKLYLGFVDSSSYPESPGWPLRNLLIVIKHYCPSLLEKGIDVIALRGVNIHSVVNSLVFQIKLQESSPKITDDSASSFVGWEKNNRGKYGPKFVDLSGIMDPTKLAERAVSLNLKLMKWRLLPSLDLDVLKSIKVLLLGAGTLGCAVARNLMAWGIHRITFVDSGRVSYSNPVRQSLFLHKHCADKGELKAKAAANALVEIYPGSESEGIELSIPMPNHTTSDLKSAEVLDSLISSHDVVFLLTDSRESRWLPTLLAAGKRKIAITAALGFDSYLVLRHGIPLEADGEGGAKLGCYFCNDITAPGNSQADRTLDQQCTVTRPGVSSIAASLAVELLVSLLQHPLKGCADSKEDCCLGFVPHSIRGFLAQFQQMLPSTPAFSQCIACSPAVLQEYRKRGNDFLQEVFKNSKHLEELTGLTQLHSKTEEADIWEYSDEEAAGDST